MTYSLGRYLDHSRGGDAFFPLLCNLLFVLTVIRFLRSRINPSLNLLIFVVGGEAEAGVLVGLGVCSWVTQQRCVSIDGRGL